MAVSGEWSSFIFLGAEDRDGIMLIYLQLQSDFCFFMGLELSVDRIRTAQKNGEKCHGTSTSTSTRRARIQKLKAAGGTIRRLIYFDFGGMSMTCCSVSPTDRWSTFSSRPYLGPYQCTISSNMSQSYNSIKVSLASRRQHVGGYLNIVIV